MSSTESPPTSSGGQPPRHRNSKGRRPRQDEDDPGRRKRQDLDDDPGRRKRPDLQPYKPGAFRGGPRSDENEEPHRGKKGGRGRHHEYVENVSNKMGNMHMEGDEESNNRRRKKKPDQAHYTVPKKEHEPQQQSNNHADPQVQLPTPPQQQQKNGASGPAPAPQQSTQHQQQTQHAAKPKEELNNERNNERNGGGKGTWKKGGGRGGNRRDDRQRNTLERNRFKKDNKKPEDGSDSKQNGFASPDESGRRDKNDHLPPRLRDKQGERKRGGRGGGRGGRHSRGSSPRGSDSARSSVSRSSPDRVATPSSHSSPVRAGGARGPSPSSVRSPSPHHPNRRSFSPSYRGGGPRSFSPNRQRGGKGGRGYRDDGWGQRYFRDGDNAGKPPSGKMRGGGGQVQTAKPSLPPRLQRQREQKGDVEDVPRRGRFTEPPAEQLDYRQTVYRESVSSDRHYDVMSDDSKDQSHVSDWSLEVEEEGEAEIRRSVDRNLGGHHGGLIRLPHDVRQQPDLASNPAWRGMNPEQMQRIHNSHPNGPFWRAQRFLYDPKNPNKPIPAAPKNGSDPPPMVPGVLRFPLDPRSGATAHQGGVYRPPFPPPHQATPPRPPNGMPEWYNVYNQRIYGTGEKHDVSVVAAIVRNDFNLRSIMAQGGGRLLCHLWEKEVAESRRNILMAFQHLLKTDLVFCAQHDIEFHIWKIGFYQLVEVLKPCLKEDDLVAVVRENIGKLLDEGMDFYNAMLNTLDQAYCINLDRYYDVLEPRPSDKLIRCALVSAQKCLLCLGDLARYKEQINDTSNYGKARQYYQKASHIETRNGRPFNQLAILATANKRKFEAVYYNMRCLQSKNPFTSSRESLTVIFDEITKKWESMERKRIEDKEQRRREEEREKEGLLIKGTRLRKEIWIKPDGGPRLHRTTSAQEAGDDNETAELQAMSTSDLNRRFNNSFLYLIGKLYTHINMDTFPLAADLLYNEFKILVSRSPLPLDSKRLVQIMALNMFVIEHTKMKGADSDSYRTTAQDAALQLAFEMFSILVERCNELLETFQPDVGPSSQSLFSEEDLPTLLSAVKVWCDWLLGNNDTWDPVVSEEPFNQLAKLATHLEKLKPITRDLLQTFLNEEDFLRSDQAGAELIKLEEDAILCGFNPWFRGLDWSSYRRYSPRSIPITLAQDVRRLDGINFCIDYLEGLEPPILKWSPADGAHVSLVENQCSTAEKVNAKLSSMLARHEEVLEESYSDEEAKTESGDQPAPAASPALSTTDSKIQKLKHRKEELERRHQEEERAMKKMQQQILSEHVSVTLEIRPRYIVPDTNCFVDHLTDIKRLSTSAFQIRVPLVVVNELDGLAKGGHPTKYATKEHAAMVSENARKALAYLRDRPANTKCMTSHGRLMPSLGVVAVEEDSGEGKTNDDLILDTCLNISEVNSVEEQGNMRVVYRDVVLLTEDRNLKLKAHTADLPVNKMTDFMQWVDKE